MCVKCSDLPFNSARTFADISLLLSPKKKEWGINGVENQSKEEFFAGFCGKMKLNLQSLRVYVLQWRKERF